LGRQRFTERRECRTGEPRYLWCRWGGDQGLSSYYLLIQANSPSLLTEFQAVASLVGGWGCEGGGGTEAGRYHTSRLGLGPCVFFFLNRGGVRLECWSVVEIRPDNHNGHRGTGMHGTPVIRGCWARGQYPTSKLFFKEGGAFRGGLLSSKICFIKGFLLVIFCFLFCFL